MCAAFLLVTVFSLPAYAGVTVFSEYHSLIPGQRVNSVFWVFTDKFLADGEKVTEINDRDQKMGCRAELYYNGSQNLVQADCYREVRGDEVGDARQYSVGMPALLDRSIVPGDWLNRPLPFVAESEKREYVVYEQIGTARFAAYLEVQERSTSFAEALSSGMIRTDLQGGLVEPETLYIVEVKRKSGDGRRELILQQLWVVGEHFWRFEAKAGRRSWRLAEE